MKRIIGRAFGTLIPAMLIVGMLGIGSAAAAVAPPHGAGLMCNPVWAGGSSPYAVEATAYMEGTSTRYQETGAWLFRLEVYANGQWNNVRVPGATDVWFTQNMWRGLGGDRYFTDPIWNLSNGSYYRTKNWFYWYSTGLMTAPEYSNPCQVFGW